MILLEVMEQSHDLAAAERPALEALVLSLAQGGTEAMAELYKKTRSALYGFSLSILRNTHDAEDVLQEAYIRVYDAAPRYRPTGDPMPWMMTIVKNLSLMKLRERRKTDPLPEEGPFEPASLPDAVTSEERMVLSAAMDKLDGPERETVMLHAVAGFKHREIAALLDMPLATVLSKYHRAIKKLSKILMESDSNAG